MEKLLKLLNGILNAIIVLVLSIMVILVFLNVVLRYGFDSGLTWSEEIARFAFVWVVFLGAVVALKDKSHLGVDLLTAKLPLFIQKILYVISNLLIVVVLGLFIDGLLKMMELNKLVKGPATGIPINILYWAGLFAAVVMIAISIVQTVRFVFFNQDPPPWVKTEMDSTVKLREGK
ncbi:TRAP transporter small permease [Tepidibacillus fermentans]|uniref:TRAP-type C4-dicarboxylate transport system permease small subunit n=1 Tax=Tepidibacillus fermentans TaxID=1281767 RepID=A0A4R3K9R8_9BACI|nr:TRAP transporter small permease [Tepidibacillus fermentans]TCS79391.1 TRAP-type C4-dicarboxylate transport system permease small subunit [Tepidibacillus fermentans]